MHVCIYFKYVEDCSFFIWSKFWASGIGIACISMCVCLCLYVFQLQDCPHDDSSPFQASVTKF